MSSGADNAVKQWVWDNTDAQPAARLLRFRSGHAAPPTLCAHYGEGLRLLSAGCDRAFRVFSTIQVCAAAAWLFAHLSACCVSAVYLFELLV